MDQNWYSLRDLHQVIVAFGAAPLVIAATFAVCAIAERFKKRHTLKRYLDEVEELIKLEDWWRLEPVPNPYWAMGGRTWN